jgi:hypothetical protein
VDDENKLQADLTRFSILIMILQRIQNLPNFSYQPIRYVQFSTAWGLNAGPASKCADKYEI